VRLGYRRWRGLDGLGGGDVKLAAMLGAWLGWQGVLLTFLLGSLVGAAVGIALTARGSAGRLTVLPYGVFLAPAAAVVVFWGRAAWTWYLAPKSTAASVILESAAKPELPCSVVTHLL
jgi:leader peptidase (prepilin peptidase)/N-methyltransferase